MMKSMKIETKEDGSIIAPLPIGYQFDFGVMGPTPVLRDDAGRWVSLTLHPDGSVTWERHE